MQELQKEVNKIHEGMILEIKLLNIDELNILIEDISYVLNKFHLIIQEVCQSLPNLDVIMVQVQDPSKLYVILDNDLKIADKLAYEIYSKLQLYVDPNYPEIYFRCVIGGIKFFHPLNKDVKKVLSHLNYSIKLSGGENSYCHHYEDNILDLEYIRRQNINLNILRKALFKNQACFFYQPVVNSVTKEIEYYEGLLRIPTGDGDYISAGPIIQDAEGKGIVNIVDIAVIEMAISELRQNLDLKLSVNISNVGILNKKLLQRIKKLLQYSDVEVASRLIIEITETALNRDVAVTREFIDILHSYGCQVALDDFGSGFTSFKQLLNLPIDIIKIDGSYIRDILENQHHRFFVEALINLSRDLKIKTVAEFVENQQIADCLTKMHIDNMQGNFFSAPVPDIKKFDK